MDEPAADGGEQLPTVGSNLEEQRMSTIRMVYGDVAGAQVEETFEGVEVEREDGWVVLFRGPEAILRLQEQHVRSLETIAAP